MAPTLLFCRSPKITAIIQSYMTCVLVSDSFGFNPSVCARCRESLGTQPVAGAAVPVQAGVILREEQTLRTGEACVCSFAIVLMHPALTLHEDALLEVCARLDVA